MDKPFFSIISVAYKDAWALTKTARSVFAQSNRDFEYIIVDGNSEDGTRGLIEFWIESGLVSRHLIESDAGVYDAMNKGAWLASGQYVLFLNAGDVFADDGVLDRVHEVLCGKDHDGCLGWGELNDVVWASWVESEAFKMASLGFCHQALFVKPELLRANPFNSEPHKTDSDTLQLGRFFANGADIPIVPEVWAKRGGEPGISANLERTRASILNTLIREYEEVDDALADKLIAFRRKCAEPDAIQDLLNAAGGRFAEHLAYMVLDTLFLRQSKGLPSEVARNLRDTCFGVLKRTAPETYERSVEQLLLAQTMRKDWMEDRRGRQAALKAEIQTFREQEGRRQGNLVPSAGSASVQGPDIDYNIVLTTFPPRIPTLEFVIRSLVEQSAKPRNIHVVIGKDELPNKNWLPSALRAFEENGVRFEFVDSTCHQYDKVLHLHDLNRDEPYVIVDDDVLYHPYAMERLLVGHARFPRAVIANRCHLMGLEESGDRLALYTTWKREQQTDMPSYLLMPTGAGGVLYPPGFFEPSWVRDVETIMATAPYADDIWLKFCALRQGRATFATELSRGADWYYRYTPTMKAGTLMATNVDRGLNDLQIERAAAWLDRIRPEWRDLLHAEAANAEQVMA